MKKHRRPTNPVMRKIDDAIDYLETSGKQVDVGSVTANAAGRLSVITVSKWIVTLLRPLTRQRLIARGYMVVDEMTNQRTHWSEMGPDEFGEQITVKAENVRHVQRHLAADKAVRKFLATKQTQVGRPVTAGEFEDQIVSIYARHGVSV